MQQGTTEVTGRMMGVSALAGLTAGCVAGIGGRIIMRIIALTAQMPPSFSIAGTLNILINGIVIGFLVGFIITIITAVFYASSKTSKYLPGPVWRGLIFALLILLVIFPLFVNGNPSDFAIGNPLLDKILFGALVIIYGLTLGIAEIVFNHLLPGKPTSTKTDVSASILNERSTHHNK